MFVWMYTILNRNGRIVTQNPIYAEQRSKLGDIVFCKRITNKYRYNQI